jgi:MFS family permease
MSTTQPTHKPFAALQLPEIRFFLGAVSSFTLANRAMVVIIGLQIYQLTHSALALGILGLVEAIPALSLSLYGGYIADRVDRRSILLITKIVSTVCALLLALISLNIQANSLYALYGVIFLAGIARGFSDPAQTAFEAQIVPKALTVNAASWIASTWLGSSVLGPALIGFSYDIFGIVKSYLFIAGFFFISWICTAFLPKKPHPKISREEPMFKSIKLGLNFVFNEKALVGSMSLDLFAVLFGGMIALLPIYATDILHVGAKGLGLLNAASSAGAMIIMLLSTHRPPIRHAGRNLLWSVAGFGVSIIVFAFSRNFLLSLAAVFLSGVFDGVSMIIRRSILRLLSPDHMRGRIAAVSWVFIGASNEIGAFESGIAAHFLGTVPAVWLGGVVTLMVVGFTALRVPQLRHLRFDPEKLERVPEQIK